MALYYFHCPKCDKSEGRFLKDRTRVLQQDCLTCGERLTRTPQAPSSQVRESLDNGVMPRRVERLKDAEILHKERSRNDPRLKPT